MVHAQAQPIQFEDRRPMKRKRHHELVEIAVSKGMDRALAENTIKDDLLIVLEDGRQHLFEAFAPKTRPITGPNELPPYEDWSMAMLWAMGRKMGVPGFNKMKKDELIEAIKAVEQAAEVDALAEIGVSDDSNSPDGG